MLEDVELGAEEAAVEVAVDVAAADRAENLVASKEVKQTKTIYKRQSNAKPKQNTQMNTRCSVVVSGKTVIVEPHRHDGVFIARGKEDALVTRNLVPGSEVYGEKRISVEVSESFSILIFVSLFSCQYGLNAICLLSDYCSGLLSLPFFSLCIIS